jgi:hypothetical protein
MALSFGFRAAVVDQRQFNGVEQRLAVHRFAEIPSNTLML